MFKHGDRIHMHDGTVQIAGADGLPAKLRRRRKAGEVKVAVRGFIRAALVDPDGTEHAGDWHENIITNVGHNTIVKNFAQLAGSAPAQWWAIGNHTEAQTSNFLTNTVLQSEYGTASNSASNAAGAVRAPASQALAGTWTLSQSYAYASSMITNNVVINALGQCSQSTMVGGSILSIATFASSSKSNNQALNVTYNWSFGT